MEKPISEPSDSPPQPANNPIKVGVLVESLIFLTYWFIFAIKPQVEMYLSNRI